MQLERMTLSNFRCFGPDPVVIDLETGMTAIVGNNGSGKTAIFAALARLFGTTTAQRALRKTDFHVPVDDESLQSGTELYIDCVFGFPELEEDDAEDDAVPEVFNHMSASDEDDPLKVRIRLQATWTSDATPAGTTLVRSIRAGGIEMEISSEAVDDVRAQLRGSFRELVGNARDEYERMADLQDIDRRLANVVEQEVTAHFSQPRPADLRATIHVRDIIFRDYLYQLVNYYPKGGGAHRRFSQRYGIIGRSWRSRKSHGTGNAFGNHASEESLVEEWGMTTDEAHGMLNSRPSCLSILLRSGGVEMGILYIDFSTENAFGEDPDAQQFAAELESKPCVSELATAVERALAPLRAAAPNFELKELGS